MAISEKKAYFIEAEAIGTVYVDTTCNSSNTVYYAHKDFLDLRKNKRKAKAKDKRSSLRIIPSEIYFTFHITTKDDYEWNSGKIYFNDNLWTCTN